MRGEMIDNMLLKVAVEVAWRVRIASGKSWAALDVAHDSQRYPSNDGALRSKMGVLKSRLVKRQSCLRLRTTAAGAGTGPPELGVDFGDVAEDEEGRAPEEASPASRTMPRTPGSGAGGRDPIWTAGTRVTRSLGDWDASRSCTPRPEMRTFRVGRGEFLRFVLASDGLWDIVAFGGAAASARRGASADAVARRLMGECERQSHAKFGRLKDDTTIIVVDVNPSDISARAVVSHCSAACAVI